MSFHLSADKIKSLVIEYQTTNNPKLLEEIIPAVDPILISVINKFKTRRPEYEAVDANDMYQTCILGVNKALLTARAFDDALHILFRVKAYAIAELKAHYKYTKYEAIESDVSDRFDAKQCHDSSFANSIRMLDIQYFIEKAQLKSNEKKMIELFLQGDKINDIAKELGMTRKGAQILFDEIVARMRDDLIRNRDILDDKPPTRY